MNNGEIDSEVERSWWRDAGTCLVADAFDRLDLPNATVQGLCSLSEGRVVVGRAVTVQLAAFDGSVGRRHLCSAAVDAAGPGRVIVVDNGGRTDAGAWGGLLSLGAATRGVEGVVVDGACRDVNEARELGLPVFARAACARSARGRVMEVSWGEEIVIDEVICRPGDLVVADEHAVAVIPAAAVGRVRATIEELLRVEDSISDRLRAGASISDVMDRRYEEMTQHG